MNRLCELAPASSPANDQLVGEGRTGNTRMKDCLEILGLFNCSFLLIKCVLWLFPILLFTRLPVAL